MSDVYVASLVQTVGAMLFAWMVLRTLFSYLQPSWVDANLGRCSGWHEEVLAGCQQLERIPHQPINTYSNLAYLAAGLYLQFSLDTPAAFVFAVTMTYLCIGSALFHALTTKWAGMLDVTGIYAVFTAIAVYALAALLGLGGHVHVSTAMFVVAGAAVLVLSPRYHKRMRLVIALCLGGAYAMLLLRMWSTGDWDPLRYGGISLALFVAGYLSWEADKRRRFVPRPWGHGFWHLFTAAASAVVFYAIDLSVRG
jgi:channel protein (hemolysin III family)